MFREVCKSFAALVDVLLESVLLFGNSIIVIGLLGYQVSIAKGRRDSLCCLDIYCFIQFSRR